jgi:hypothetical protein
MLEDAGIITVSQLLKCTPAQLLDVPRFGAKALVAVYRALAQLGFPVPKDVLMSAKKCEAAKSDSKSVSRTLTAEATLQEVTNYLEIVRDNMLTDNASDPNVPHLNWILDVAKTRSLSGATAVVEPAKADKQAETPVAVADDEEPEDDAEGEEADEDVDTADEDEEDDDVDEDADDEEDEDDDADEDDEEADE